MMPLKAQVDYDNIWNTLALVKMNDTFGGGDLSESKISGVIESIDGQEVEVKGYIIPLSGQVAQSNFMFSAYPYSMCYFCGNAGPESVMEVFTKDGRRINFSDNSIRIRGKFKWRSKNPEDIMFELKDAVLIH